MDVVDVAGAVAGLALAAVGRRMTIVCELGGVRYSQTTKPTTATSIRRAMPRVEFLGLGTGVSSGGDGRSVALAWSAMGRPHLGQASAASLTSPLQSVHLISAMVFSLWVANGRLTPL